MADGVAGLVLAAGAGRRFGGPKALVELDGEPLLLRAMRVLAAGGCDPLRVVLGASAETAAALLPDPSIAVTAAQWHTGMGASLRTGLDAVAALRPAPVAVLVHLVDLPGVNAEVVARMLRGAGEDTVARASYAGIPGHPVLFGARHWAAVAARAGGDRGARDWLAGRSDLRLIDCTDLGSGEDVDVPADLPRG